jgi:hypothetical protein
VAVPRAATPPRRGAAYGAILSLRATQAALFEIVRPAEFVMNWKTYFLLTGIIFALVALARALRRSRAAWRRERPLRERCCEAYGGAWSLISAALRPKIAEISAEVLFAPIR